MAPLRRQTTAALRSRLGAFSISFFAAACVACGGSASATAGSDSGVSGDDAQIGTDTGPGTRLADSGETLDSGGLADSGRLDSGTTNQADADNGAPNSTYPAFKVDVAQIVNGGGSVMAAPVVVTVTFSTDTQAATWNALGDAIGTSSYWHTINGEYGIGQATSGSANHVSITDTPAAQMSDDEIDSLVAQHAGVDWPAPTANTIYALYLAPQTTLYFGGLPDAGGQDVCAQGVGGYHSSTMSKGYVYAVMPQCSGFQAADVELSATHELNEAATDPPGFGVGRLRSESPRVRVLQRVPGRAGRRLRALRRGHRQHRLHAVHGATPVVQQERSRRQPLVPARAARALLQHHVSPR